MILKTDQELAMIEIQQEVRKKLWNELVEMIRKVKEIKEGNEEGSGYNRKGSDTRKQSGR